MKNDDPVEEKSFTLWFDLNRGACLGVGDDDGPIPAPNWTLDDLNEGFPPWHARGHSITSDEARRLSAIVGVEYSERFRLEIGVAIQMTVERLIFGQPDMFAALEKAIVWRNLRKSLNAIAAGGSVARPAAIGLASALDRVGSIGAKLLRLARTLIGDSKRKRGRPEPEAIVDFYGSLIDVVRDFNGSLALPSNNENVRDGKVRETPLMVFAAECARMARAIGEKVIEARSDDVCLKQYRMTADQRRDANASLEKLELPNRALSDRLRGLRQETEIK